MYARNLWYFRRIPGLGQANITDIRKYFGFWQSVRTNNPNNKFPENLMPGTDSNLPLQVVFLRFGIWATMPSTCGLVKKAAHQIFSMVNGCYF